MAASTREQHGMTTEASSPAPRYESLRDYLRVLRRYWIMIVLLAIIGGAAGLLVALRKTPVYQATAEVGFQDPTQELSIVGLGSAFVQTPGQLAEDNAQNVTSPSVIVTVKRRLNTPLSVPNLIAALSAQVSASSGLLNVTATSKSPEFAASLANATSSVLVSRDNAEARAEFLKLAANIRSRIARASRNPADARAASGQLAFYEDELARLETVAAYTRAAQVVTPAQPPTGSNSDRTRSTLLGLGLGLLLGILAAFIRDSTDRRLRTLEDMRSAFKLPLIGRVRDETMGQIVPLASDSNRSAARELEAFRILRRNLEFLTQPSPPRTVLVTSAIAEEGKSTVAASLALTTVAAGRRTLLIDCDLRRPALAKRFDLPQEPGLAEYLAGTARPEQTLRTVPFAGGEIETNGAGPSANGHVNGDAMKQLVFIPSGKPPHGSAELLKSVRFEELIREVSQIYDVIIIDSSPLLPVSDTLEILPYVDAILLCARDSRTTRDQATAVATVLSRFPKRPTGLIVTGITRRDQGYFYDYDYDYAYS